MNEDNIVTGSATDSSTSNATNNPATSPLDATLDGQFGEGEYAEPSNTSSSLKKSYEQALAQELSGDSGASSEEPIDKMPPTQPVSMSPLQNTPSAAATNSTSPKPVNLIFKAPEPVKQELAKSPEIITPPQASTISEPVTPTPSTSVLPRTPFAADTKISQPISGFASTSDITANAAKIKAMRTYESDIAEVLSQKGISSAAIAIAESKRNEGVVKISNQPVKPQPEVIPVAKPTPPPAPKPIEKPIPPPPPVPKPIPKPTPPPPPIVESAPLPPEPMSTPIVPESDDVPHKGPNKLLRNISYGVISLLLVAGGIYAGYYLYSISPLAASRPAKPTTPVAPVVTTLVPSDSYTFLPVDGLNSQSILAKIRNEAGRAEPASSIHAIILTQTTGSQSSAITAPVALGLSHISMPDMLARSLDKPWMLGVFTDVDGSKSGFVVLKNTFFQNAFAGILQWESTMTSDLSSILGSSMSTTSISSSYAPISGHYEDHIVNNTDVRSFVDNSGHIIFAYSFIDNSTLAIAGSETTLTEIMNRLDKQKMVR